MDAEAGSGLAPVTPGRKNSGSTTSGAAARTACSLESESRATAADENAVEKSTPRCVTFRAASRSRYSVSRRRSSRRPWFCSGSVKRMLTPMTFGPAARSRVMASAMRVRGQGQRPSWAMESSSMATSTISGGGFRFWRSFARRS
jgi:hypothetical protein